MLLSELIDVKLLGQYIDDGIVRARPHPRLPLQILNYSPAAQSVQIWTDTLSYCRGLVYDTETLEVIAIPFKKFFSYDDPRAGKLPEGIPFIFEKADGSYLNLFFYKGEIVVSTRGSFESDQAKWAAKWVEEHLIKQSVLLANTRMNYVFEVIIPEDRKVVEYEFFGLVLLGAVDKVNGTEYLPSSASLSVSRWLRDFREIKQYDYEDLDVLQKKDIENQEGYVALWFDGPRTERRKIKFDLYKTLHKLYFQTSTLVIWDLTRVGKSVIMELQDADQALKDWAGKIAADIRRDHDSLRTAYTEAFRTVIALCNIGEGDVVDRERRKLFAMYAKGYEKSSLLFTLFDGKMDRFEEMVWEFVKPASKQFFRKTELEEG